MDYTLRWDTFQKWTEESIKDFYQDSDYTDVTLITEDMQVFVSHRIILSSSSDFFKEILGKIKRFQGQTLYLKSIQGSIFSLLLKFIYGGEVTVSQQLIPNFLSAAADLKIKGIHFEDFKDPLRNEGDTGSPSIEGIQREIEAIKDEEKNGDFPCPDDLSKDTEDSIKTDVNVPINQKIKQKKKSKCSNIKNKKEKNTAEDFKCVYDTCDVTFNSSREVKKHIMKTHSRPRKEKLFGCDSCEKKFPTKHEAEIHLRFRHGNPEKKYSCGDCNKKFLHNGELKMHQKGVHLKIRDFHCLFCDFSFSQKCNLKTHMIKMHTEEYYDQVKVELEEAGNETERVSSFEI